MRDVFAEIVRGLLGLERRVSPESLAAIGMRWTAISAALMYGQLALLPGLGALGMV